MHLWNDYEGKTLAGVFPLERLLRTEGRSACFATRDSAGRPTILRLTEALNDQEQLQQRYGAVQAVHHPHLVRIEDFGDTEVDGEPLVYLVTEWTEESLADILSERKLSLEETGEVAAALVGALEALHANGMVHGLVEASCVLAAGEVIKLRSDCVRSAPTGIDGARAYGDDVFGVADVIHRALTQQRLRDASDALALPEPYASIVRNVVRGSWGIEQVASEVRRHVRPLALPGAGAAYGEPPRSTAAGAPPPAGSTHEAPSALAGQDPSFAEALAAANRVFDRASEAMHAPVAAPEPFSAETSVEARTAVRAELPTSYAAEPMPASSRFAGRSERAPSTPRSPAVPIAIAVAVLVALLLALHFAHSGSKPPAPRATSAAAPAAAPLPVPVQPSQAPPAPAAASQAATPAPEATPTPTPAADAASVPADKSGSIGGSKIWRVVAYTYNRQDQAEAKVRALAGRYSDLHPEVFSRTGNAPYLVTLGGPLSEAAAAAMRKRARSQGVARDVYMQNYSH